MPGWINSTSLCTDSLARVLRLMDTCYTGFHLPSCTKCGKQVILFLPTCLVARHQWQLFRILVLVSCRMYRNVSTESYEWIVHIAMQWIDPFTGSMGHWYTVTLTVFEILKHRGFQSYICLWISIFSCRSSLSPEGYGSCMSLLFFCSKISCSA